MHIAVDKIGSGGVADRHHGEGCDKEEGYNAQGTVVKEFHPQVANLYVGCLALIHYHTLLTLAEAEEKQGQSHQCVDGHGGEPCRGVFGQTLVLLVSEVCNQQGQTRSYG